MRALESHLRSLVDRSDVFHRVDVFVSTQTSALQGALLAMLEPHLIHAHLVTPGSTAPHCAVPHRDAPHRVAPHSRRHACPFSVNRSVEDKSSPLSIHPTHSAMPHRAAPCSTRCCTAPHRTAPHRTTHSTAQHHAPCTAPRRTALLCTRIWSPPGITARLSRAVHLARVLLSPRLITEMSFTGLD